MQANSHSLAHRGLSTLCTRARWQPYASIQPSSMWTPSGAYLHTPASSSLNVLTPAPALHNSICELDLTKPLPPHSNSHIPSQPLKDIHDIHKHKYVTGLIGEYLGDFYFLRHSFLPDATIRSLCEIWNLHDILAVFLTQACVIMPSTSMYSILPLNGLSNSSVFTAPPKQLPFPQIPPPYLPGTSSSPHISTAPHILSHATTHCDLSSAE